MENYCGAFWREYIYWRYWANLFVEHCTAFLKASEGSDFFSYIDTRTKNKPGNLVVLHFVTSDIWLFLAIGNTSVVETQELYGNLSCGLNYEPLSTNKLMIFYGTGKQSIYHHDKWLGRLFIISYKSNATVIEIPE